MINLRLLVDGNFKNRFNAPVIGRKGLSVGNFFDADKSEMNWFDLKRICCPDEQTVETATRFETTGKLKTKLLPIINSPGRHSV